MAVKLAEVASAGDKIDIRVGQRKNRMNGQSEEEETCYKSSLSEFLSDEEMEISMPTENGKMVLFQVGSRCSMLLYTKRGLYTCEGVVTRRYKKENLFLMSVVLRTQPAKFQRREFFRINCMLDLKYYKISPEVSELKTSRDLYQEITKPEYEKETGSAVALDISGGGLRFTSDEQFEAGSCLVMHFRLTDEKIDQTFYLVTQIVASEQSPNNREKFMNRAKFLFKDLRDREVIVRYVFEEERRLRKKENG